MTRQAPAGAVQKTYALVFITDNPRAFKAGAGLASRARMSSFQESARVALQLLLSFDPALWTVVGRSLAVSGMASLLGYVLGVWLGMALAVHRFAGRGAVLGLLNTLLALPSVVVGLAVYLLLSRSGPLGALGWLFSFKAMVLAQFILVLPIVMALTRQQIEARDRLDGEQWTSQGLGPLQRAALLAWDERLAMATIAITALGRAVSEVGAVMIVGGNIDGFTRVMTTAIALETSKGDLPLAMGLGLVLLAVVGSLHLLMGALAHGGRRRRGRA